MVAPVLGTPTFYSVVVYRLSVDGAGGTQSTGVAGIVTTATTLTLPPGVLVSGETYYCYITSKLETGIDANEHPYRRAFPTARAELATGKLTP